MQLNKGCSSNILSVDFDEMAFAMALFRGASNGRVSPPIAVNPLLSLSESRDAYDDISLESLREALDISGQSSSDDVPLAFGLAMLWHHYQGDERQQIICSRLLAFYDLITRRVGPILGMNADLPNQDPGHLFLDPSVIRAVACAPLSDAAGFDEANFRDVLSECESPPRGHTLVTAGNPFLNSDVTLPGMLTSSVRQLTKLLYIYEACARPPSTQREFIEFHVLKKFCGAFTKVSGSVTLQALLSRALASTRSEYPWLGIALISERGEVKGSETTRRLSPTQALSSRWMSCFGHLRKFLDSQVVFSLDHYFGGRPRLTFKI